ncbi:MAG: class III signal peptide [Pyrobaculum sp.]
MARGMTSLEIAIIVAIVLIIAVAVGWYIYTTFVASATGQPRLNVITAEIKQDGTFNIVVMNPGPVDVQVSSVEIAGQTATLNDAPVKVAVGEQKELSGSVSGVTLTPGTMLSGRVILSGGQSFPFNAAVKP